MNPKRVATLKTEFRSGAGMLAAVRLLHSLLVRILLPLRATEQLAARSGSPRSRGNARPFPFPRQAYLPQQPRPSTG